MRIQIRHDGIIPSCRFIGAFSHSKNDLSSFVQGIFCFVDSHGKDGAMQVLKHRTSRFINEGLLATEFALAVEELLEIYIDGAPYAVTMRLPGDDIHLVAGFCFTEGIIDSWDDFLSIEHSRGAGDEGRVSVRLKRRKNGGDSPRKDGGIVFSKTSSALCGRSAADQVYMNLRRAERFTQIPLSTLFDMKVAFEARQTIFQLTGSTHSASIFDRECSMVAFSEDVGRHNAFDKAIGSLLQAGCMEHAFLAIVSSRLSFEMIQKAGVLGLEIICALSAPTSMAVRMAEDLNITLIGFLRDRSFTIYTHPHRILET